jgi:membrane protein YqaA with SNARE-associated domain
LAQFIGTLGMSKRLYEWLMDAAHKPHVLWVMGFLCFGESMFVPLPPDVVMITMCLARPEKAWSYAKLCTLASVSGGLLGYAIGALLYGTLGHGLIALYGYDDKVDAFREAYRNWGAWTILFKGVSPIPYKIVTITSGFAGYNLWLFVLFSLIARGARFYCLALLLNKYGAFIREAIERRLLLWFVVGIGGVFLGFLAAVYLL